MFSALGIDYGTNSVRALVVDCATGKEPGAAVVDYPSGNQGVLRPHRNQAEGIGLDYFSTPQLKHVKCKHGGDA